MTNVERLKKGIILKESNKEKVEALLNDVQKRCTVRTIDYQDILYVAKKIEKLYPISKKALNGCTFDIDIHANTFPSAYKFTPESTQVILEFKNGNWKLLEVSRFTTRGCTQEIIATLTDCAKDALIHYFSNPC